MRDIGVRATPPKNICKDSKCPWHGTLPLRGQVLEGVVVSNKSERTAIVRCERVRHLKKYERHEKRSSKISVHNPPCINAKMGDRVRFMECRPLAKTKSFALFEVIK